MGIIGSIINNQSGPATIDIDVLLTDGRKVTDPIEIAKLFTGYFLGVGKSLEQKIPQGQKQIEEYMIAPVSNSFAIFPLMPQEVIDLAKLAKSTRSQGPDNIDPLIARQMIEQVADMVSNIVKSSFETGIVPLAIKSANIVFYCI